MARILKNGILSVGSVWWFEYHCEESPNSADAKLWYRSHKQVKVLGVGGCEPASLEMSLAERIEAAMPVTYVVRFFEDGFVGEVFEDELVSGPEAFQRPAPPTMPVLVSGVETPKKGVK